MITRLHLKIHQFYQVFLLFAYTNYDFNILFLLHLKGRKGKEIGKLVLLFFYFFIKFKKF